MNDEVEALRKRLRVLPRAKFGAFFACCAERMLPLFRRFSESAGFGEPAVLETVLGGIWATIDGKIEPNVSAWLEEVAEQTPHADDFDTLWATIAQDCCVCVDAAARSISSDEELDTSWIQYPWEALKMVVTEERTGYLDAGGRAEASSLDGQFLEDDRIQGELAFQRTLMEKLENSSTVDEFAAELRALARRHAWSPDAFVRS